MKSSEIRNLFLKYFADKGHQIVESASLIPANDPTLLFTNAGMVPFKECFLGTEDRGYTRATSSQRCVRAGGKHNDLENVGYTARHHTFFEMLGNFSFGDYFKEEAIRFAWDFLTKELKLPEEKLWVTVYKDDKEAEDIWFNKIGINQQRFSRLGEKDNFWSMGDTGPCGPSSEIFYDHGPQVAGGPPGSPDEDGDRYIEIWNLVFMQFNRHKDGTMEPLPKPSVDTGMGLERIAAVLQNVHSNYEIDLFANLIDATAETLNVADKDNKSLRVIADHIRSCSFLILDGVLPSNEGRGYVLRRIIRRAIRHGNLLGAKNAFFFQLVASLVKEMGDAYPGLADKQTHIETVLKREEEQFAATLDQGLRIFEQSIANLKGDTIPGEIMFRLYDTYGFPADLTADIARERGLKVDQEGFESAMQVQRERARAASQFDTDYNEQLDIEHASEFKGYEHLVHAGKVLGLISNGQLVDSISTGDEGLVILDHTPFYAESGGQVGDKGTLRFDGGEFEVADTIKVNDAIAHKGKLLSGSLKVGTKVDAEVEGSLRARTALNHSATHLLHAALRKVLGEHVTQKGSLCDPLRLRFDFSHLQPVSSKELKEIEALVNAQIRANLPVETAIMTMDEAMESGAMALFGEKYGDRVRVLKMGDFSVELCGGTHVERTGDIGFFKIVSEGGIAAGVRRIEAITGPAAFDYISEREATFNRLAAQLKVEPAQLEQRVSQMFEKNRQLEKQVEQLQAKMAASKGDALLQSAIQIGDAKLLVAELEGVDPKSLRDTQDQLKNKLGSAIVVIATRNSEKVNLAAGVTKDLTDQIKAGELVNFVAQQVGGKGGGRPDMAQAGGTEPAKLPGALNGVEAWVRAKLGQ